MWEVFTCCDLPYGGVETKHIFRHVYLLKMRPQKPEECPDGVYEIMSKCWGEVNICEHISFHTVILETSINNQRNHVLHHLMSGVKNVSGLKNVPDVPSTY